MKKDMGGLRKYMPQTFMTFVIGTLALAGIFPLAGFWSKDEILVNAGHNGYSVLHVVGLVGAFMTAAYMTRCVYLTFFGEYRGAHGHARRSRRSTRPSTIPPTTAASIDARRPTRTRRTRATGSITVPLWILSFFAVFAGLARTLPAHIEKFKEWFEPRVAFPEVVHPRRSSWSVGGDLGRDRAGRASVIAYAYYWAAAARSDLARAQRARPRGQALPRQQVLPRRPVHRRHRRLDQGPDRDGRLLVQPARHRQRAQLRRAAARGSSAAFTYDYIDQRGVDGIVNGLADGHRRIRRRGARASQTGRLQFYALMLVCAVGAVRRRPVDLRLGGGVSAR